MNKNVSSMYHDFQKKMTSEEIVSKESTWMFEKILNHQILRYPSKSRRTISFTSLIIRFVVIALFIQPIVIDCLYSCWRIITDFGCKRGDVNFE